MPLHNNRNLILLNIFSFLLFFLILQLSISTNVLASSEIVENWMPISGGYTTASHVSFINSGKLYVIAGSTTSASQEIVYAELLQDGSTGDWVHSQHTLPEKTFYHSLAEFDNYYYILGGVDSQNLNSQSNIYISNPKHETRDIWEKSDISLPDKLASGGAIAIENNLYFIGGVNKVNGHSIFKNQVYFTKIMNDGSLSSNWKTTLALENNQPWVGFSPVFTGSRIILVGGKDSSNIASNKVYEGIVNLDTGEIEDWVETFPLPTNEFIQYNSVKVTKVGNYIIAAGGTVWDEHDNRTNSDIVFFTQINSDGTINPWAKSNNRLPYNTCCGSLNSNDNYLYYVGGFSVELNGYHDKIFFAKHNIPIEPKSLLLNVEYQSQLDNSWSNFEYDNASKWFPSNPFISRWGCALTSASMVLNYFNFPTNPKLLNQWLISQPDGFIRNGLVNWLAISRYSKINNNDSNNALEFIRFKTDDLKLRDEIENLRPAIARVPGHFVVVKGIKGNEFLVNDPSFNNHSLLSQVEKYFGGNYSYINSLIPSNTDLSYIMLVINASNDLRVYDTSNNLIENNQYYESPIINPFDNNFLNNEYLNIFTYPKPAIGKYNIDILGSGHYNLDVYYYNNDGDVVINNISETNDQEKPEHYSLFINEEFSFILPRDVSDIFKFIENEIVSYYKIKPKIIKVKYRIIYRLVKHAHLLFDRGKPRLSKLLIRYAINYLSHNKIKYLESNFSQLLNNKLKILNDSIY